MKAKNQFSSDIFGGICVLLFVLFTISPAYSGNPVLSKYLINLSAGVNSGAVDDVNPEIVVQGNTIHAVWIENKYGVANPLYYCRSEDLGNTWETPVLIGTLVDVQYANQPASRELAVDGSHVHIAFCDYNWSDNGTGRIYYFHSPDGGKTFEQGRIIATTGGGYAAIHRCSVKSANGKVAIAYVGGGAKSGVWTLYSEDGGANFTDTRIFEENNDLADFYFDGDQMIILHTYAYYYYGLNIGRVYVTVSNGNGSYTTNKISVTYPSDYGDQEKCLARHDYHYAQKIAKSGSSIHVIFDGSNQAGVYTILYARSANNGVTFEKTVDINNGVISNNQGGQETIESANGHVYLAYLSTNNKLYFCYSEDNGNTFSTPANLCPEGVSYISGTWWPGLVADPNDATGKTVFITGNSFFSARSVDGGSTFSKYSSVSPFLKGNISNIKSDMAVDNEGGIHWISEARWRNGTDLDIFYRKITKQPGPGQENKAYYVENKKDSYQTELTVVPSSETISFDSAMTAEAWVKFLPGTEFSTNILAKVDGYDGYDYQPSGFNMGFRYDKGKMCVNSGIKTDKGDFVNWGDCTIGDTIWHHVAFSYDARGGLNNFKTYVDGLLRVKQTVTGSIIQKNGMLMIGAREAFLLWYNGTRYFVDDIRLWDRALTQEELLENQTRAFSGQEDGLKLWLSFDDTFKDISGNGNDAIPVYNGELIASNISPPKPGFEMYQAGNKISFNNKTTNGSSYLWNFGNSVTSEQGNPQHAYSAPGEYQVSLTARNATTVTAAVGQVTIEGLDRIEPAQAGNAGAVTLVVFGGGLIPEGGTFFLRRNGTEIPGSDLWSPAPGQLAGRFLMSDAEMGKYDVVVQRNASTLVLEEAFSVVEAVVPEAWVSVSGRGAILFNMWQTYTISYGNKGNTDALGVPLYLVISNLPGLDIEFIDCRVEANQYMKTHTPEIAALMDTLYTVIQDYFGPGHDARFYPLYLPLIEANSSHDIHIRVKSPGSLFIEAWTNDPFFETILTDLKSATGTADDWPDEKTKLNACIALSAADAASSSLMDFVGLVLPVDCVYDFGTFVFNPWDAAKPEHEKSAILQNWGYSLASAAISCIGDLSPIAAIKIGIKITAIVNNIYKAYKARQDCLNAFDPRYKNRKAIGAVSSFDPNEMVGPSGYGEQNYIAKYSMMPYTILFENKGEASAPAHIVTITDTLNLSVFDISNFGFSSFGWGDTIFSPPGNKLNEFSMDIDLRPAKELITRVSGKLDTLTGVVRWQFLSLNPETMDLEEDPMTGFLPPNVTSPEGEGFVSFSAGLKAELGTNDIIRNQATIVFDANKPIITNEYLNTLDLDPPQSRVYPLEAANDSRFPVNWTGSDEGSGIAEYTLYVLENDTLLYPWLSTSQVSAEFDGAVGSAYKFYSVATDHVSLKEDHPAGYDAQTTVTVDVEAFERMKGNLQVWPNPADDKLEVTFSEAPLGVYIVELISTTGAVNHSRLYREWQLQNGIEIPVSDCLPGNYLLRLVFGNQVETRKVMVQ